MITRRKLLQFLGLGGAAAAVAPEVARAALPAPPSRLLDIATGKEPPNTKHCISLQTLVADERAGERIAKALEDAHRDYLAANEGDARAFYDEAPFFTDACEYDITPITLDKIESRLTVNVRRPNGCVLLMDAAHRIPLGDPVGVRADGVCERFWKTSADVQWLGVAVEYDWDDSRDEDEGGWVTHWKNPRA